MKTNEEERFGWIEELASKKISTEDIENLMSSPKWNEALNDYKEVCLEFSKDTMEWGMFDDCQFYTTDGSGWKESCDNAHGGVDVTWAFHGSEDYIKANSDEIYFEKFTDELENYIYDIDGKNFEDNLRMVDWLRTQKIGNNQEFLRGQSKVERPKEKTFRFSRDKLNENAKKIREKPVEHKNRDRSKKHDKEI